VAEVDEELTEAVQRLGAAFWSWRSVEQPRSRDDIPRLERPAGWLPDWSQEAVAGYYKRLSAFEDAHRSLKVAQAPVSTWVDHALLGSALARARFELEVLQNWKRQPSFYVDQSVGVLFDLLVPALPFDEGRCREVVRALQATPPMLDQARENLAGTAVAAFADVTVRELAGIEGQLGRVSEALEREVPPTFRQSLSLAAEGAAAALGGFRDWLAAGASGFGAWEPLGEEGLRRFLVEVALVPFSPSELLELSRTEYARAVALSAAEATRPAEPSTPSPDVAALVRKEAEEEAAVRRFYVERGILSQPASLGHYLMAPMPAYLEPISWLGVTDDLTSEGRLDANGVRYLPPVSSDLPYFFAANATDPRSMIVHEGAHYQQLALSWRHPDPLRRRYYDSCPNEGIAFYNEELLLQAGLFDDSPATRRLMLSFMRLRALRVEVDVRLALGDLSVEEARDYLVAAVPMDVATAAEEAASFAANPGQGLSYQVGKAQIQRFLAAAKRLQGEGFSLQAFHDYLWLNGNVPISLLQLEYLGSAECLGQAGPRGA
jgi:hypothetical protein